MNREEAERALGIIRTVVQNTRDDLIARNWGLVWMIHAFTNFAGFAAVGLLVERQGLPIYWYLVPLAVLAAVNVAIIAVLTERDQGIRSFVELQLHGIWTTFIVFSIAAAALLLLVDAPPTLFGPLMAMTSGIGFALTGVIFYRRFLLVAALFLAVMLVAPLLPTFQWLLIAAGWWIAMFVPGYLMHREKQRRLQHGTAAEIL